MLPATVCKDCTTVSLDGGLPTASNSLLVTGASPTTTLYCPCIGLVSQNARAVPLCVLQCWQGFLCATLAECRILTTNRNQSNMGAFGHRRQNKISCESCLPAAPCRHRSAGSPETFLDKFHFELPLGCTGPCSEPDRQPVLPCFRWWQNSRSCRVWHLGESETGDVGLPIRNQHSRQKICRRGSRLHARKGSWPPGHGGAKVVGKPRLHVRCLRKSSPALAAMPAVGARSKTHPMSTSVSAAALGS